MSLESIMAVIGKVGDTLISSTVELVASKRPTKLKKKMGNGLRSIADKIDPKRTYAPRKKKKRAYVRKKKTAVKKTVKRKYKPRKKKEVKPDDQQSN